ncbi:leucine-rich repeat neuronal protein 1-like [Neocloeon triangulifer]|uniref:leucine-rich repeat neuronal protein 1-like n=1 Tax=Neocloeon triangulifer TaxID=2078957 RepID=UPI00286EC262|nr:leucine-rich repeat neuronal protein 1-like [Neocloeon triangulifer]
MWASVLVWLAAVVAGGTAQCPLHCRCDVLTSVFSSARLVTADCSYQNLDDVPADQIPVETEALSLKGNSLKELTAAPPLSSRLKELDVSSNRIKAVGRGVFGTNSSLIYLNLAKNELSTIFSDTFSGLEKLENLVLSDNRINYIEDGAFVMLNNLKGLNLDSNMIGSLYEEWFLGLRNLVNLSLAHNIIHHVNRNVFRATDRLQRLVLSGNRINGIEPQGFAGLSLLHTLLLDNNLLAVIPNAALQTLGNLRLLKVDMNPVSKLQAYSFSELSVQEISASKMSDLRIVDGFSFHNLYNLTIMSMEDNDKLDFIDPEAFANTTKMAVLRLNNNNLRGLSRQLVTTSSALTKISLLNNPLLCDCNFFWIKQNRAKFESPQNLTCAPARVLPIECGPQIVHISGTNVSRKLGDPLTLECRAMGVPIPRLHWILPDGSVLNATSNSVRLRLRNPGTLIFYHLKATDSGVYTCVAENKMATARTNMTLMVSGIDINLFPTGISANFVTLVWNGTARNSFPTYQILYRRQNEAENWSSVAVSSFVRSYTISQLAPDTTYRFCITFEDKQSGFYVNISCTLAKTQHATFMLQGIQNNKHSVNLLFSIVLSFFILALIGLLVYKRRTIQHRLLYETPNEEKSSTPIASTSNIPMDNLYSPLISNSAS